MVFELKYLEIYSQRGNLSIALLTKLLVCEICWNQGDKHLAFMSLHDMGHVLKKKNTSSSGFTQTPTCVDTIGGSAGLCSPQVRASEGLNSGGGCLDWSPHAFCICACQCPLQNELPWAPTAVSGSLSLGQEGCWALQLPFLLTGKMVLCQVTAVATNCKAH